MPMHMRVCAGGGQRWGCAAWVRGSGVPHQQGCPHWGVAPQHVPAPQKGKLFWLCKGGRGSLLLGALSHSPAWAPPVDPAVSPSLLPGAG